MIIVCFIIINGINKALSKLEYRQAILSYDIHILNRQIKDEEHYLLHNNI